MNKTIQIILIVLGSLLVVALLIGTGWFIGQQGFMRGSWAAGMMGGRFSNANSQGWDTSPNAGCSTSWLSPMGNRKSGMMGRFPAFSQEGLRSPFQMGPGMMGRGFSNSQAMDNQLTMEQTQSAFEEYLATFENNDLAIHEIMIFDNNAYAIVIEKSTGLGAMELLLDPATMQVYPEYGPNHMWNLKYGMMGSRNLSGWGRSCGMGGITNPQEDIPSSMEINVEQAAGFAQEYLDNAIPGASVAGEGMTFYGYYTFDYQVNGEMAGMLSVNGSNGQVWLHTWHGDFIEEQEFD